MNFNPDLNRGLLILPANSKPKLSFPSNSYKYVHKNMQRALGEDVYKFIISLLKDYKDTLFIAGGFCTDMIKGNLNISDIDFFFRGSKGSPEENIAHDVSILKQIAKKVDIFNDKKGEPIGLEATDYYKRIYSDSSSPNVKLVGGNVHYRTKYTATFSLGPERIKLQFITSHFDSILTLIKTFDLDSSCISLTDHALTIHYRAVHALNKGYNTVDCSLASRTFSSRLCKYFNNKGIGIFFPLFDQTKIKDVMNLPHMKITLSNLLRREATHIYTGTVQSNKTNHVMSLQYINEHNIQVKDMRNGVLVSSGIITTEASTYGSMDDTIILSNTNANELVGSLDKEAKVEDVHYRGYEHARMSLLGNLVHFQGLGYSSPHPEEWKHNVISEVLPLLKVPSVTYGSFIYTPPIVPDSDSDSDSDSDKPVGLVPF